jgi:nicotinate phosphoribosyltransferase
MFNYTATYTDQYQLTMAQAYFLNGQKENIAVFDYFFRKLPFEGGYAVFAGLEDLLNIIGDLKLTRDDLEFLG